MAELELWFVREPNVVLDKTTFRLQHNVAETNRRTDKEPIQWRSGVQAHMVVLIRWAISARVPRQSRAAATPIVPAEPGTPAYCVYHSLTKPLKWRDRLLGELPVANLIHVKQHNRKPFLYLNQEVLKPADIKIFVDGGAVEDSKKLGELVDDIESQWRT